MSTGAKIITLLIMGALFLAVLTHPAGFASGAIAGGSVLDNTLALESGQGVTSGVHGSFSTSAGNISV